MEGFLEVLDLHKDEGFVRSVEVEVDVNITEERRARLLSLRQMLIPKDFLIDRHLIA